MSGVPPRIPTRLERPLGFAHRGARAHAPENTLESFELALRLGATALALRSHSPYEANLLRLAGLPYTLEEAQVRNAYDIHLVNKESHRVTFDFENGYHLTGYVATVRPPQGDVITMALSRVEISNDAGEVVERHREMVLVPSVMTNYRLTEGPSAKPR